MAEKQMRLSVEADGEETVAESGVFGAISRFLNRLTEGFWDAVSEKLCSEREVSLSRSFLSVILFLSFSGLCTIACLCAFSHGSYVVPFALTAFCGTFELRAFEKTFSSFSFCASVLFGTLLSCLFLPHGGLLVLFLFFFLVLRVIVSGGTLRENPVLRILFASSFAALFSLSCLVFYEEVASFSVWNVLISAFLCGLLSALFCGFQAAADTKENVKGQGASFTLCFLEEERTVFRLLAVLAFFACVLNSLKEAEFMGFSPAFVLACLAVLFCARRRGALFAAFCGGVLGFAAGGAAGAAVLFSVGIFSAIGFIHSTAFAASLSFAVSCAFLLLASPAESFALYAADLLASHLIFFPLCKVSLLQIREKGEERERERGKLAALQSKLLRLSEAFGSLSEVFYMATDARLTPEGKLCESLSSRACERVCARCSLSTDCWHHNYGLTQSAVSQLCRVLLEKRAVTPQDLVPYFKNRCKKADALCREINRLYAKECSGGADGMSALLCGEYGSVSRLLSDTAEQLTREEEVNSAATHRAEEVLKKRGIPYRTACVSGTRQTTLTVTGVPFSRLSLSTDELLRDLKEALGMEFEAPRFVPPLEDATMVLVRKRLVSLSCARAVRPRGSQSVSGDTTGFFESDSEYFYSLICDGMGSGRDAAFTSRLATIFIEKLLTFSREKGVTLEMLNRFLLAREEERFSTVDLLEIDFYTARANFIKAGAAASYVKRGTGLYRIASKTPPAGILESLCAEQTTLKLSDGDCVVMFSDGVVPSEESDAWFAETLAFAPCESPQKLATHLLQKAREHHGEEADDMSVAVLQIHAA